MNWPFDGSSADGQLGSTAFSTVEENGRGRGGNVEVTADSLSLSHGAALVSSTDGRGDAGNVLIHAGQVRFDGTSADEQFRSGAFSTVDENGRGRGGNVEVTADSLSLSHGAKLSASTLGHGNAGDVVIHAGQVKFDGTSADGQFRSGAFSTTESNVTGQSGDIEITANGLRLLNNSAIRTDDQRRGDVKGGGGNIRIDTNYVLATNGSDILAFSSGGRGGNIDLPLFFSEGNVRFGQTRLSRNQQAQLTVNDRIDVNASGRVGGGNIAVITPDTSTIQNSLADLPNNVIDTEALLANSCIARNKTSGVFLITGTGGLLPNRPGSAPLSPYPTDTVRTETEPGWRPGDPIIEPQGVYRLPNGDLVMMHDCPLSD